MGLALHIRKSIVDAVRREECPLATVCTEKDSFVCMRKGNHYYNELTKC